MKMRKHTSAISDIFTLYQQRKRVEVYCLKKIYVLSMIISLCIAHLRFLSISTNHHSLIVVVCPFLPDGFIRIWTKLPMALKV